jgi:hypothetical protein
MTLATKCDFIRRSYFDTKESSILNYFTLTGILGNTPAETVASRLLSEGLFSKFGKFQDVYAQQQSAYLDWKLANSKDLK